MGDGGIGRSGDSLFPGSGAFPLFLLVALTLAFRAWLAAVFPITGDEAYFTVWGLLPAPGYYDHPPMVGRSEEHTSELQSH